MSAPIDGLGFPRLQALLEPHPIAAFFAESWERKPLLVRRQHAARDALLESDWRELLRQAAAAQPRVPLELLRRDRAEKLASLEGAERALSEGLSLRVFHVERVWPALQALCSDLSEELGFAVAANLYVTPAGCQGLGAHVDDHDVFIVQLAARKDWRVHDAPYPLPLEHRAPLIFEERGFRRDNRGAAWGARGRPEAEREAPVLRETLAPGDLLYLPRGAVHWATASDDDVSVHVTIGVHATTWADLASLALVRAARDDVRLRETLPPGATRTAPDGEWLRRELESRSGGLRAPRAALDALEELAARFSSTAGDEEPPPTAAFDPGREYRLGRRVLVVRRGDTLALRRYRRGADDVLLPAAFEHAIREMRTRERFRLSELRTLSARGALVLGRELHRVGLLTPIIHEAEAHPNE